MDEMYHPHCPVAAGVKVINLEKPFYSQRFVTLKVMIRATSYTVSTIYAQLHLVILYKEAMEQCKLFHCAADDY